ncbi:MAG: TIGR00304 family protein [Methanobacterium sp.]|uniref:TIGR00304 family membrane protein n=1 Tax=Methanobacterium sp. TaxID=2164 RepID=UPI003C76420E
MVNYNSIILMGFVVVILGILLIFIGTALQSSSNDSKTEIHTGGVILIGPIPIIFGNDKTLILFGVIFAIVLMILSYFLFYRGSI